MCGHARLGAQRLKPANCETTPAAMQQGATMTRGHEVPCVLCNVGDVLRLLPCMRAAMHVRQQGAALGIVFFIRVLQYLSVYNVHATGCDVTVCHSEEDLWVLVVCALLAHPPRRSSSTSWSVIGFLKAMRAGLGDAAEALGG